MIRPRGTAHPDHAPMNRIPALWAAAYGSRTPRLWRYLARRAVHLAAFLKALALADHRPFTSL